MEKEFSLVIFTQPLFNQLTEECGVVYFVESKHGIMSDLGFSIQELCAVRSLTLNKPKQK